MIPFAMIEVSASEMLTDLVEDITDELIGGDLSYDGEKDFYVWIGLVGGLSDETSGQWSVDIDVFDSTYGQAMNRCLEIEAALLGAKGHQTQGMIIDRVYQNEAPTERPGWDEESSYRVGATYVFTARRRG